MLVHLNGFRREPTSPVQEIHQALHAVGTDPAPHLLGYTAVARVNPFQALLYREFGPSGVAVAPVLNSFDFDVLPSFHRLSASQTIHFHWINWVIGVATDAEQARTKVRGFLGRVDKFRDAGGKVVWTAHNVYPHDATFIDEELELQQGLADRADAVHLMAASTTEAMDGLLSVDPDRVVIAPHPSYVGAYEDYVSRQEARAALGIDADETVFVLFGALKAYKGLHALLDGFQELCRRDDGRAYRLVVAGHPDEDPDVQRLVDRCIVDPNVLIEPHRIPGAKAQYYLRCADAGLVTYTRSLNSGAALLYLSFGLPVLATDTPVFREALPAAHVQYVGNPADAATTEMADALASIGDQGRGTSRSDVLDSIAHLHSSRVSSGFRQDLGRLLGW
ncbi:glycosyltransferase [Kocuria palustris]|uniref:glycosyltransferase n=1 Tax=Kocuria palustris TaxID=71999 RepID=UPI0021A834EE|nr:glycosyltransferase [Kocuria palustris]MCT1834419.1 glycosyltransferase [Kocuria palustris]